jgi:hypothetical protein
LFNKVVRQKGLPPGRDQDKARKLATVSLRWTESPVTCTGCQLFDDCLGVSGIVDFMLGEVEESSRHMTAQRRAAVKRRASSGLRRFQELETSCPRQRRA